MTKDIIWEAFHETIPKLEAEVARLKEDCVRHMETGQSAYALRLDAQERIDQLEEARLALQLAWEDSDTHPRCGAGSCAQCDEVWECGVTAALAGPQEESTEGLPPAEPQGYERFGEPTTRAQEPCERCGGREYYEFFSETTGSYGQEPCLTCRGDEASD